MDRAWVPVFSLLALFDLSDNEGADLLFQAGLAAISKLPPQGVLPKIRVFKNRNQNTDPPIRTMTH